jgi:hypothetical protein
MGLIKGDTERMGASFTEKLGEEVLLVARVQHQGNVVDLSAIGVFTMVAGAFVASDTDNFFPGCIAWHMPREKPMRLVVTDRRLLFFKSSTPKTGPLLAEFPVVDLVGIRATKAKVRYGQMVLMFRDASQVAYDLLNDREVPLINAVGAERFG